MTGKWIIMSQGSISFPHHSFFFFHSCCYFFYYSRIPFQRGKLAKEIFLNSFHSWNFLSSIGSGITFISFAVLILDNILSPLFPTNTFLSVLKVLHGCCWRTCCWVKSVDERKSYKKVEPERIVSKIFSSYVYFIISFF